MTRIVLNRFITGLFVILSVITITFFLLRILPGGPFDLEKKLPPQIQKNIEAKYNLDQPVWKQYVLYLKDLVRGDFGPSYKYVDRSVNEIIGETLPVSFELGIVALLLSVLIGLSAGVISFISSKGILDYLSITFSTVLVSVPSFVVGAVLIYFFSIKLKWFPAALWGGFDYIVLPALTLAAGPAAYIARLVRASMLDISNENFVRTARAKGLGEFTVVTKHILFNAFIPVITVLGPITAFLVTGSFVVEHIFAIPGIGRFFVQAVTNRDYPLVMGITIVYSVILVFANFLVDICYVMLDPRIKFERTKS